MRSRPPRFRPLFAAPALAAFALLTHAAADTANDPFAEGNTLFAQGDYLEAAAAYQTAVARGESNANLFVNLGLALARSGRPGQALLNFERALALEPGHRDAQKNLDFIRAELGIDSPATTLESALQPVSANTQIAILTASLWAILLALACLPLSRRRWIPAAIAIVAAPLAAWALAGLLLRPWNPLQPNAAIVTTPKVLLRLAPAESASTSGTVTAGTRVKIDARSGSWLHLVTPDGAKGWAPSDAAETIRPGTS